MRQFFRGWERNVGSVLLGIAIVLIASWNHSIKAPTTFTVHKSSRFKSTLESWNGSVQYVTVETLHDHLIRVPMIGCGPGDCQLIYTMRPKTQSSMNYSVPYWSIVVPLTLLSAWLLLLKPRKLIQKPS